MKTIDIDYIPEQHESKQIHVWYNTHPKGGSNKEGNVFLIPTQEFKKQIQDLKYLRLKRNVGRGHLLILLEGVVPLTGFSNDAKDLLPALFQQLEVQQHSW